MNPFEEHVTVYGEIRHQLEHCLGVMRDWRSHFHEAEYAQSMGKLKEAIRLLKLVKRPLKESARA